MVDNYPQYLLRYTFSLGDPSLAAAIANKIYFPVAEILDTFRYLGTKTRAETYLGTKNDSEIYLGTGQLFPI